MISNAQRTQGFSGGDQSISQSIDRSLLHHKNIVTQWIKAKLDKHKLVKSLSQLLINYYR